MRCNSLSIVSAIHQHAEMLYPPLAAPLLLADPRALGVASDRYIRTYDKNTNKILQLATYGISALNFMCVVQLPTL